VREDVVRKLVVCPHNGLVAAILGHEYSTKVALSAMEPLSHGQPGRREGQPRRREKEGAVGRRGSARQTHIHSQREIPCSSFV
jgi:hypothetical protein